MTFYIEFNAKCILFVNQYTNVLSLNVPKLKIHIILFYTTLN